MPSPALFDSSLLRSGLFDEDFPIGALFHPTFGAELDLGIPIPGFVRARIATGPTVRARVDPEPTVRARVRVNKA